MDFNEFAELFWCFNQEVLELGPDEAIRQAEAGNLEHLRKSNFDREVDQTVRMIEEDHGMLIERELVEIDMLQAMLPGFLEGR